MTDLLPHIFSTFVPEAPIARIDFAERFIAIATPNNVPIEQTDIITAVEGYVLHTQLPDGIVRIDIQSTQLKPKPDLIGEHSYDTLEITVIDTLQSRIQRVGDILSNPDVKISLGVNKIGHDYHRTKNGLFEIKRKAGGILGLDFERCADGLYLTEIKETPGIEGCIRDRYKNAEPSPRIAPASTHTLQ